MRKLTKNNMINEQALEMHAIVEKRIVSLDYELHGSIVSGLIKFLDYLTGVNNKPITLRISSPGGSVDRGLILYDYIKASKVPIYTECWGLAASMAAILLAAGKPGYRRAAKNARIMIHQPSSGYIGKASDIEVHAKETARIKKLVNTLLSNDTGQPVAKVTRDTELDLWMTAEEAKKYGIIDKII